MAKSPVVSERPTQNQNPLFNPEAILKEVWQDAKFSFRWGDPSEKKGLEAPKKIQKKRRMISHPNGAMRKLHEFINECLRGAIGDIVNHDGYLLRKLPSATGCVKGLNPYHNAKRHEDGEYLYITDFSHAYPSVDLEKLTALMVFIVRHREHGVDYLLKYLGRNELARFAMVTGPLYRPMMSLVQFAFGGFRGKGLAVGGNLSPYLLNLYCEVFVNSRLRDFCQKFYRPGKPEMSITMTQYVDDYVFSRGVLFPSDMRREIRRIMGEAGFEVNHRKSYALKRGMGTVFVTKQGLRSPEQEDEGRLKPAILVFPQKKRRRIHGIIQSYLCRGSEGRKEEYALWNDWPEAVRGLLAEFIYYYKNVEAHTATDRKTMALCKEFQRVSDPLRKHYRGK